MAAPETPKKSDSGGFDFTKKLGPFPLWLWLALAGGLLFAIYYHFKNAGGSTTTSNLNSTSASQIPQIVNETYTTVQNNIPKGPPSNPPVNKPPSGPPNGGPVSGPPVHGKPIRVVPRPPKGKMQLYDVQPGDNLFDIAKAYYGNGNAWHQIYNANKRTIGNDPNLIKPGQKLSIPDATRNPHLHDTYYTIQAGNTLSSIAKKYDTTWEDIYAENKSVIGRNPNMIHPGTRLTIQKNGVGF